MLVVAALHMLFVSKLSLLWEWTTFRVVLFVQLYNILMLVLCRWGLPLLHKQFPSYVTLVAGKTHERSNIREEFNKYFIQSNMVIVIAFLLYDFHLPSKINHAMTIYWTQLVYEVFLCYFVFELLEYGFHRLLHHEWFFKNIHYVHHRAFATESITGFYMHPVDVLLQVVIPSFLPPMLFATSIQTLISFFLLGYFYIHTGHSGYTIEGIFSSEYHFIHHQKIHMHYSAIEPFLEPLLKPLSLQVVKQG